MTRDLLEPRTPTSAQHRPTTIADLVLGAAFVDDATAAAIHPDGPDAHVLTIRRGARITRRLEIDADVAAGAVARLAHVSGLDPLIEVASAEARANVTRITVSAGERKAEVLLSIAASSAGFHVEARVLTRDGRERSEVVAAVLNRCLQCKLYDAAHVVRCTRCNGPVMAVNDDPRPGGTIGPWLVGERLGGGAMGEVYAAHHALLDRDAALKILRGTFARWQADRFVIEARAASRVHDANVVEISDVGVLRGGEPYLVMERLRGESLAARLMRDGSVDPVWALRIARAIAAGLVAAHHGGVVHNDLKPSNVMLLEGGTDDEPKLKLVDFGAASFVEEAGGGPILGTAPYLSPERALGEPADGRSDVYSLGIVIYEMLCGAPPFDQEDSQEILHAHVSLPPPPMPGQGALPARVVALVDRALAKKPEERYQSAAEMIIDIDRAIASFDRPAWRKWLP